MEDGGVREGRGGERLQEEVFYRGKSGNHFPLVFKERVRGRVEALRKRHHFGSVQSQACSEKWEGFLDSLKNRNAFVRSLVLELNRAVLMLKCVWAQLCMKKHQADK